MAAIQSSSLLCSQRRITKASINIPKLNISSVAFPKLQNSRGLVHDLELIRNNGYTKPITEKPSPLSSPSPATPYVSDPIVITKLYAIMDAVADRVEMHKNICEQRNNWNSLLLTAINTITLSAATMAGIAATAAVGSPLLALKMSSTLMYLAATGMLIIMNKIQPSQLAEEQRNATRLCKQLHNQIQTLIAVGSPTARDVDEALEKVLAIDRAFPLPLLGKMIEKFPSSVEPTVWWPKHRRGQLKGEQIKSNGNGWSEKLEEQMKEIVGVLNKNDKADYLRLGEKALKINKVMAKAGPLLTGIAAVGSAFVGSPSHGSWAVMLGVAAGSLASVVNTLEHGGQVGMVVELYRSNAGFFKQMEEDIEFNLNETDVERRDNGELFEMKVALNLGRSLSELRDLADCSRREGTDHEEFGSKLF
ncbi:putative petal formation-expressed [Heracleum sosnowskyi]|uniref:Petal formation-expressed n=1 Tax=Heracleum sosnowskyi TaxID=360622 RepID=A0AAD8HY13_9APIA|nr:putative petal formation-expressed [Heracleum sosnowskyi]